MEGVRRAHGFHSRPTCFRPPSGVFPSLRLRCSGLTVWGRKRGGAFRTGATRDGDEVCRGGLRGKQPAWGGGRSGRCGGNLRTRGLSAGQPSSQLIRGFPERATAGSASGSMPAMARRSLRPGNIEAASVAAGPRKKRLFHVEQSVESGSVSTPAASYFLTSSRCSFAGSLNPLTNSYSVSASMVRALPLRVKVPVAVSDGAG